ncbi:hephaestin-like protein [Caerostris darwini]|uniref:Hephaestin-like protein n=1 Tax=Caerostris darwini TaxID=1538125 RepID=A0AAV4X8B6_9ARAC|nr:hephaestin-like protein [Caerostris darwini]
MYETLFRIPRLSQYVFVVCLAVCLVEAQRIPDEDRPTRTIYIGAVESDWDYAPEGNLLGPGAEEYLDLYLSKTSDPLKLGKVYKKSILWEFTDDTFTIRKPKDPWMGLLGPILQGEVGDILNIVFYNMASHPLSIHPHGVRYQKIHEGALYDDNTTDSQKIDDRVQPGAKHIYRWLMNEHDAPTENDPDCLTWMYHSHRHGETELHAGLLGPLLVCRKGALSKGNVDRRVVLVFMNFDENKSVYIDENIERQAPTMSLTEREEIKKDAEFRASNLMHTINGLAFGNLFGLEFCVNERISWHLVGMGDVVDVHTASFGGHVVRWNGHKTDDVSLLPAKFTTSYMVARRQGVWPIRCEVGSHGHSGMEAFFRVKQCNNSRPIERDTLKGKLREVFIAAEEVEWDYAPFGFNFLSGLNLTEDSSSAPFFEKAPHRVGGVYRKAVYREYTDATFTVQKQRNLDEVHLGIMGPTLRGEVGDMIKVTFKNKASFNYSLDTHGAYYLQNEPQKTNVTTVTYWTLLPQYGPTELDPDCLPWRYYSDQDFKRDAYDGLNGILLVCREGTLDENGKQKKYDREFTLLFSALDENEAHYIDDNVLAYAGDPYGVDFYDRDFRLANRRYSINGRMYGNLEGLTMCTGDRVIWNILGVGRSIDLHTAYFHGNNFLHQGIYRDTVTVVPSIMYAVEMKAENEGDWIVECRTNSHLTGGMRALYRVAECPQKRQKRQVYNSLNEIASRVEYYDEDPKPKDKMYEEVRKPIQNPKVKTFPARGGKIRDYFVAAVEEEWEYAPKDRHLVLGGSLMDSEESKTFVERGNDRIGTRYKKALFREFTDATFTTRKCETPQSRHLGVLGPMIKAEVGDVLRVTFRNMASRPYSFHPHGILHHQDKNHKHLGSDEDPVYPGNLMVYEWLITENSGPGPNGFNCTPWAYYSAVDPVRDTNAGLIGPIIICRQGILTSDGGRSDSENEFAVLYTIMDENESWYIQENIMRYTYQPLSVDYKNRDFKTSNRMHAVNGRIYGTLEGLVAKNGTKTAWYLLGMGSEDDLHTAHFHGQTFLIRSDTVRRGDVVDLFPGYFETVEMTNDNPGTWILHCHVDDHMRYGMAVTFTVTP